MDIESFTGIESNYFNLQTSNEAPRPWYDMYQTKLCIAFELNQDVTLIERSVYNSFMLLGDVGGFSGILFTIGAILISFFTHNNPQNYLAAKLYKSENNEMLDARK